MSAGGEPDGDCLARDGAAESVEAAALDRGDVVARWGSSFARLFEWLFARRLDWLFAIRDQGNRALPHGVGVRGGSVLPTSPGPIEVWS
jgi:hypothetical protein